MNRRTLLQRFLLGAAAVLGAGMVVPKVEATKYNVGPGVYIRPAGSFSPLPTTELADHCMTCDWVGTWSTKISEQQVRDGLSEFHNHVMYEHDGSMTAMGRRGTVWRRALHDGG